MKKIREINFKRSRKAILLTMAALLLIPILPAQYVHAEISEQDKGEVQNSSASLKGASIPVDSSSFPDVNFRDYVTNTLNISDIDDAAIAKTKTIDVSGLAIQDLTGIEYFSELLYLKCDNNSIENLTLQNAKITDLECGDNPALKTLNIQALTALQNLDCGGTIIEKLDLSMNTQLQTMFCNNMQLTELDLSHNNDLNYFDFSNNQVTSEKLVIGQQNKIVSIIGDNNLLTDIDVSGYPTLLALELPGNFIDSFDLSNNPKLESLYALENQLVSLDLSNNPLMSSSTLQFNIDNQKAKVVAVDNLGTIDMSLYDANFDGTRVSELSEGVIDGNKIINAPTSGNITYKYYAGKVKNVDRYVDVTLQLKLDTFTIDYKLNGGVNHASNPSLYKETDSDIILNAPTKSAYNFEGWFDQATGGNKITSIPKGSTGNKTLYAQWSPKEYTIQYANLFESTTLNPLKYTIETNNITLSNPSNRLGYTFVGWYDQAIGGNKVASITKGSSGDRTLYARWEGIKYDITYNNLFSTTTSNPLNYTIDDTITLSPPSKRLGYSFEGWFDQATGGNKVTSIAKGNTGNKTLYAQWKKTYFEDNDSKGSITFEKGQDENWELHIKQESVSINNDIKDMVSLYDIYCSLSGVRLPVQNLNMTVSLNLEKKDQGYTNYKIVYLDEFGVIQEEFIPTLVNNGTALQFQTTHLSYYGIVAWNEAKIEKPNNDTSVPTGDTTSVQRELFLLVGSLFVLILVLKRSKSLK